MEIKRRDFLKLFGGFSGALLLGGCGLDEVLEVPASWVNKVKNGPKIETWKNTICGLCSGGCGIQVRLIDGLPVHIKGNPNYPVNQGGMCPLGINALHHLYNPDRIQIPMKRVGNPLTGKWEPISWEDAFKIISQRLIKLRRQNITHQLVILGSGERGVMKELISRFASAYGSPNYYQFSSLPNDAVPYLLVHGQSQIPSYDFLNAKIILSFGSNFLEEGFSPIYYTKLYSHHREQQTRYIQIEPRMSLTAANADSWVPIRPGTYGALALGLAYVLIREELYNEDFVTKYTFGFEDWIDKESKKHIGFRNYVLENYYPEKVSEITGVSSELILELGRELGNTPRALVLGGGGALDNTNGTFSMMAIQSLNGLLGNYERKGGIYFIDEPPYSKLPPVIEDSIAKNGNKKEPHAKPQDISFPLTNFSIESFTKNILRDNPYPIDTLFLFRGNPLFHSINHHEFVDALKKTPFIVSFDSFINETNEYAHLILPVNTFLEDWNESSNIPSVGFSHIGIQQPVIEPLFSTRSMGDIFIDLAKQIGGTVSDSFPFENYKQVIEHKLLGVYNSGRGAIASKGVKKMWLEYLQQRGWQISRYSSYEEFWDQLLKDGGWWNPIREEKRLNETFKTPSGKFEFYSQKLKNSLDTLLKNQKENDSTHNLESILSRLNITARGDAVYLPHHEIVPYEGEKPFYFTTFQVLPNRDGKGANLPLMQEMFGYSVRSYWRSWVEINPINAEEYGIKDGDWIWIESSINRIKVQAKVIPAIMPNVIAIPFGLGHTSYGRYAKGYGVNPNSIMHNLYDYLSGKPALDGTKVKISLAS